MYGHQAHGLNVFYYLVEYNKVVDLMIISLPPPPPSPPPCAGGYLATLASWVLFRDIIIAEIYGVLIGG